MKVQIATGGLLALLAPGLSQPGLVNLLQGEYRPKQDHGSTWRRWRVVAGLAAALLLLHVAGSAWQLFQLKRSEAALDESIEQAAAIALPGEPLGGNLRRRVEQRLGAMAGGGGAHGDLLHLLAAVAAAHDNVPVTTIGSINFKPGEMEMRVSGPDAASLEQLNQALRAGGYQAEVTSGSTSGATFEGRILMRSQGS
jgi:general secretion pathway protein L